MRHVILALAFSVVALTVGATPSAGTCTSIHAIDGCSSISNTGTQVDISGNQSTAPGKATDGASTSNIVRPAPPAPKPKPAPKPEPTLDPTGTVCFAQQCSAGVAPTPQPVVYPEVAVADLVSFRPHAAAVSGEPTGVGVVGMPTNILAAASTHDLRGELLGYPVLVRFVPQAYIFDFGDGTTITSVTGGTSWAALRQAEFTPTATSHNYGARGNYRVTISVRYGASVLFDDTLWRQVNGQVRSAVAGYDVRVVTASTALVDKTCIERPRGPGC